jgi:hypothetical protein
MRKEQILSILRHTLTFVGGILITKGLIDETLANEIVGSIITLTGLVWGVVDKTK